MCCHAQRASVIAKTLGDTSKLPEPAVALQGDGLPDLSGPTARLIRSAEGEVLKVQPVPAFNATELPGVPVALLHAVLSQASC